MVVLCSEQVEDLSSAHSRGRARLTIRLGVIQISRVVFVNKLVTLAGESIFQYFGASLGVKPNIAIWIVHQH